ncbi:MAG: type II toxin-antitoxin system VapC family toxin [Bacteroidetes bacterium]|nr:type II toxin-antitoxin system VapC family toxin [Bacteroidota bacterium]
MNFLWDTNILIHYIRSSDLYQKLDQQHSFFQIPNRTFISVVSVGEIFSIAKQRGWKTAKLNALNEILKDLRPLPIAQQSIIEAYADIDAYSQGKHSSFILPKNMSARNMGKNDLWIAASAHALKLRLVTTDKDFSHLKEDFIELLEV